MLPSERAGALPPLDENVGPRLWAGFVYLVSDFTERGYFAYGAPHRCDDDGNHPVCGTDTGKIGQALLGNVGTAFPLDSSAAPSPLKILDTVEYLLRFVGKPEATEWHPWMRHTHFLKYNRDAAVTEYQTEVNALLARCGHPFAFVDGRIERRGPGPLHSLVVEARVSTGDKELDGLLADATLWFHDPDSAVRRNGLEKLWDAWERLKSLEDPSDKRRSTLQLIAKAEPEPKMASELEEDARLLTDIGNKFAIRHKEVTKQAIGSDAAVDYLFYRLFGLMHRIMKGTGRVR